MKLQGKVAIVTGAAQGIGEAYALRLAQEGAKVVVADIADGAAVAREITGRGGEALVLRTDVTDEQSTAEMATKTVERFGRIDILINNVGGAINFKPFTEFTQAEIAAEVQRSLMPTLWCCRAVLPTLVAQGGGVIVNVSSVATRGIHRIPYSAAKGGVNALTESLAFEVAEHGIRVAAAGIGGTEAPPRKISRGTPEPRNETERAWFQAHIDQTKQSCLMKRYGTLDEMAAPILFLASDEASYITGSVLPVGGGDQG